MAWNKVRLGELLPSNGGESKQERERLLAEIRMLKALKHKNIMSFYSYWWALLPGLGAGWAEGWQRRKRRFGS